MTFSLERQTLYLIFVCTFNWITEWVDMTCQWQEWEHLLTLGRKQAYKQVVS